VVSLTTPGATAGTFTMMANKPLFLLRNALLFAALVILWVCAHSGAKAAQISQTDNTLLFAGDIQKGDLEQLTRKVSEAQLAGAQDLTLSLNSQGGSFEESLRLANFVNSTALQTRVASGSKCLSACAIVFLAGASRSEDEAQHEISRTLEVGAELGFHLPYAAPGSGASETKLRLDETEAAFRLSKVFEQYDVPRALWSKLLRNDASHSLFDATTVEAIILLGITIDAEADIAPPVTRQMAENICINGYYLSQRKLPSADYFRSVVEIDQLIRIQPIIRPNGIESNFLLLPTARKLSPNGVLEVITCKVSNDAVCQGFFWPESVKVNTEGETQIEEFQGCQFETNLALSVPPTTRLSDVKTTLGKMKQSQTALLQLPNSTDAPSVQGDEHMAAEQSAEPVVSPAPAPPPVVARPGVVCNANQSFANVRAGPNSKQFHIVATLPNQTSVTVVGETRNPESNHPWYEIKFDTRQGFVDAELIQNTCLVAMPPRLPPIAAVTQSRDAVVCNAKGDSANLRDTPNPKLSIVRRKMFNHETLSIVGEANNPDSGHLYFKVRAQGVEGYVDSELVSTTCSLPRVDDASRFEPAVATPTGPELVVCNARSPVANLRSGPNAEIYGVLEVLGNKTRVRVLSRATNPVTGYPWFEVLVNGTRGYVDASSVAAKCDDVVRVFAVKTICNRSLAVTNMRSGPNKNYTLVSPLANDTRAEVLETVNNPETGHPWVKIRANGLEGYVDSELVADQC
jgi:uncharacterized protein YraI